MAPQRDNDAVVIQRSSEPAEAQQDREMYDAATILGEDDDLSNVSYAVPAQAEVMLK